ncbi:hypothetical protein AB1Y20_022876 [Prymnesium parvum]|uniref:Uncharacterized protein n=1 Tax=Prymnesium parvum TaxID=97485 RepID=A0AB34JCF2_PRYPA
MATAAATAAAAAAPLTGAAVAPVAPPARLGANAGDTTVSRHVGAPTASDPDEFSLPSNSPVIAAFPFLQWVTPPPGSRSVLVAMSELQGVCIAACNFNMADSQLSRVLRSANLVESGISPAACSAILHELHDSRLLEVAYDGEGDFWEALAATRHLPRFCWFSSENACPSKFKARDFLDIAAGTDALCVDCETIPPSYTIIYDKIAGMTLSSSLERLVDSAQPFLFLAIIGS